MSISEIIMLVIAVSMVCLFFYLIRDTGKSAYPTLYGVKDGLSVDGGVSTRRLRDGRIGIDILLDGKTYPSDWEWTADTIRLGVRLECLGWAVKVINEPPREESEAVVDRILETADQFEEHLLRDPGEDDPSSTKTPEEKEAA